MLKLRKINLNKYIFHNYCIEYAIVYFRSSMAIYEELSEIFSSDLNQKASRDLLIQVCTELLLTSLFDNVFSLFGYDRAT